MDSVGHGSVLGPEHIVDLKGFIDALVLLRAHAGNPPYRELATNVGKLMRPPREIPFRTVADVFQPGRRRLDMDLVLALVRALGAGADKRSVEAWRQAYVRVHVDAKAGGPVGVFRQLPADIPAFTGRQEHLRRLIETAEQADPATAATVVISAIEGMAGVGKTRLALHAAHHLARSGRFGDLQLYADLRGFDSEQPPADPATVLDAFLRQLEVPARSIPTSRAERAAMFRDRLHGKRALILLDNAADERHVSDLIPATPGCLVLITSRRTLAGLDGAELHLLDVFDEPEAVELLGRLAGLDRIAAEPEAAAEIARACGYLPLAVSLAGARLRTRPSWTLADLAARLRGGDHAPLQIGGCRLTGVFDLSYRQLAPETRRVFRLLGLFPGDDFSASAAAALVDGALPEVEQALEALVDANLLEAHTGGRYRLHDLLRAYACEKARQSEPEARQHQALARLARWYLYASYEARQTRRKEHFATPDILSAIHTEPAVAFTSFNQAAAWFDAERANILAVVTMCDAEDVPPVTWQLPRCMIEYYLYRAAWAELEQAARVGLAAARRHGDLSTEAALLTAEADMHVHRGEMKEAIAASTQASNIFERIGGATGVAHAAVVLSNAVAAVGRSEEALPICRKAVETYRAVGDVERFGLALNNLSHTLYGVGRYSEAAAAATEAVEVARSLGLGARANEASALDSLGQAYRGLGMIGPAADTLRQSVEAYRDVGDRFLGGDALDHHADVLWEQGKTEQAARSWSTAARWLDDVSPERAARIRRKVDDPSHPREQPA